MKKVGLIVSIILLTGVITFSLLFHRPSSHVKLVRLKGAHDITNLTKGHFDWLSTNDYADKINAIPAQENDLIYCLPSRSDGAVLIIQNKKQTDKVWKVRSDSLGAYLDERLTTLLVSGNDSSVSHWLEQSDKEDIRHLQSVFVSDSLTENAFQSIRKVGEYTSGIGLIVDSQSDDLYKLQQALKPSWLWISSATISPEAAAHWNTMDQLEYLILTDVSIEQVKFEGLKRLKMLHIDSPDSLTLIQLNQLPKSLTALQISNSEIRDLGFLKDKSQLKQVTFNHCPLLSDISSLEKLPHLKALSLADCDSIADLTSLNGLKELRWFAPPKNISEQQLASILKTSPNIEALVLVDCQHIKSLNLMKDARKLSFLTLISTPLSPDSLVRFTNLKYLAYGAGNSNDSLSLARLQKEMPDTLVTAAEPFCMGTGWLIVFFAGLIILVLAGLKLRSRIRA